MSVESVTNKIQIHYLRTVSYRKPIRNIAEASQVVKVTQYSLGGAI